MTRPNTMRRFWERVQKTPDHWIWKGGVEASGYGCFMMQGKLYKAHRLSYQAIIGPIPDGKELDHLCRVKLCVNPSHLEAVTHRENVLRGEAPTAQEAKRTHCPKGHPLVEGNLSLKHLRKGHRLCKICFLEWNRAYYAKHRNYWREWGKRRRAEAAAK
jgi:hypothetical protein